MLQRPIWRLEKADKRLQGGTLQPLQLLEEKWVDTELDFVAKFPQNINRKDRNIVVVDRPIKMRYSIPCLESITYVEAHSFFGITCGHSSVFHILHLRKGRTICIIVLESIVEVISY